MTSIKSKMVLTDWDEQDRPREKLLLKGSSSLSDAELLAILIRVGNTEGSAVDLSKKILNYVNNNLIELGRLSAEDFISNFKGIGKAKAITIMAALELGRRRKLAEPQQREKISSSQQVYHLIQTVLEDLPHEEFWFLLLNRANKVIKKQKLSQGTTSGTLVDIKIILKEAITNLASSIILCHNHPSDNCKPSESDIKLTHKIKEAAQWMDIQVLDHIIVCSQDYFSMADEGLLH